MCQSKDDRGAKWKGASQQFVAVLWVPHLATITCFSGPSAHFCFMLRLGSLPHMCWLCFLDNVSMNIYVFLPLIGDVENYTNSPVFLRLQELLVHFSSQTPAENTPWAKKNLGLFCCLFVQQIRLVMSCCFVNFFVFSHKFFHTLPATVCEHGKEKNGLFYRSWAAKGSVLCCQVSNRLASWTWPQVAYVWVCVHVHLTLYLACQPPASRFACLQSPTSLPYTSNTLVMRELRALYIKVYIFREGQHLRHKAWNHICLSFTL